MSTEKDLYHASPQVKGSFAHRATDTKSSSTRKDVLMALPIYSEEFHVMGKIDVYKKSEKRLIERKYQLKQIFQGHIYQLWAQYFCMREMGYIVERLSFYVMSTNKMIDVPLPTAEEEDKFKSFIIEFMNYQPSDPIQININKCIHCIYCNLCDKSEVENVY